MTQPESSLQICPDCQLALPAMEGETHAYLGASPACWALYGKVLAREYSDPSLMAACHRTTVDAYAAQHPGRPEPRTIQSINVHLVGLYLTLVRGLTPEFARRVIGELTRRKQALVWLDPPLSLGDMTIADVADARTTTEHEALVERWGRAVWEAWSPHHRLIIALADTVSS